MKLIYVRHAEPTYNPDALTELGKKQASLLAKRLEDVHIDKIYCSSHNRALETASTVATNHNLEIIKLDWAREDKTMDDFGLSIDGHWSWCFYFKEIMDMFNRSDVIALGSKWYNHELFKDYNFKRGVLRINKETDNFFKDLGFIHDRANKCFYKEKENDDIILFVAHGGFGMAFLSSILDIPYNIFAKRGQVDLCSITEIDFSGDENIVKPIIVNYSDTTHLENI